MKKYEFLLSLQQQGLLQTLTQDVVRSCLCFGYFVLIIRSRDGRVDDSARNRQ